MTINSQPETLYPCCKHCPPGRPRWHLEREGGHTMPCPVKSCPSTPRQTPEN